MSITTKQVEALKDFFQEALDEFEDEWLMSHVSLSFQDEMRVLTITIDKMNCQEFDWLKEASDTSDR